MAYETDGFDAALSAAAGEDLALRAELRAAFLDSADRHIDLLSRARCDGNWHMSALRLRGLAASFHAEGLLELADAALATVPGDPAIVRALSAWRRTNPAAAVYPA